MRVQISEIKVNPGRREASPEHIRELAKSIEALGLLNPITIDREHTLIAGLHRLEAVKLLGRSEIDCTISSLEGLQAELAEIDENFVRSDLSTLDYGDLLLRRKEIYETLHPETKPGVSQAVGMNRAIGNNVADKMSATLKSFVEDTAEKLGVAPRTVRRQIQAAKNLTPEAKEIIRDTGVSKKNALKLSRLEPEQQKEAATMLAAGEIRSVDEYQAAEPEELPETEEPEPAAVPYHLEGKQFASFKESIADLKDPNKDCSCTTDIFLAEYSGFVRKFIREIEWYGTPHYEAVFPALTPAQLAYLRQQTDTLCAAAEDLFNQVERNVKP